MAIKDDDSNDKSDKLKTKKKKKPKEEEDDDEEQSDDKPNKKKKKSKLETESEDEEEKPKKKKKSNVESKVESRVESKVESKDQSLDVEKAVSKYDSKGELIVDPMKDKNRMKILKKCISHLCLLVLILGIMNVFLGLCAHFFYNDKSHLVIFGGLCIMQLIGASIGWIAIKMGSRILFLVCFIINLIWIISVLIMMVYYWFIRNSPSFNNEIALHVGVVFFMSASITLSICCFLMMKRLDMINIQYKKPEVIVSADGKASEKAKLKERAK